MRIPRSLAPWLVPLALLGCADDADPGEAETAIALTSTIPASDTCNQGVGASKCIQAPPFDVTTTAQWIVNGTRGAKEYAGADSYVDQPFALRDGDIITAAAPQPASFAKEVLIAAGLDPKKANEIPQMLSAEHASAGAGKNKAA